MAASKGARTPRLANRADGPMIQAPLNAMAAAIQAAVRMPAPAIETPVDAIARLFRSGRDALKRLHDRHCVAAFELIR